MLKIGRKQGQSIVLVDGGGLQMVVTVTELIRETGYINLLVATAPNCIGVTLAPGRFIPLGASLQFEADVTIHNDEDGPVFHRDHRLAFDLPKHVHLWRLELVRRPAAKAVAQ